MTHRQRLSWLAEHGFEAEDRGCEVPELGTCVWVDGIKGERSCSLWLSARDGAAVIHGVNEPALTWEELIEWVKPTKQPEPVKVVAKARTFSFGDDDDAG